MWLWQAGAARSGAVNIHERRSDEWREDVWRKWVRIWLRGLVWWGEIAAAAVENWARGEGRRRRRPVGKWVSGRVGRGAGWWCKWCAQVVGGGQGKEKDGEGRVQAGGARVRRTGRVSRGGTSEGGRVQHDARDDRDARGTREGWDWVDSDLVPEDVGTALTKPTVWVPEESPRVQAPYLCEEACRGCTI